jgi:hypothetical protein
MNNNNNNTRGRGKRPTRARGGRARAREGNQMIPHPPQLPSYGITRDVRLRFASNAAFDAAITFQNLLDTILLAVGATSGFDLFEGVRVNSVEAWAISAVGTPATVIVVFSGVTIGAYGDQKTHTDTSVGIEPAHVKAKPDPLTQAGQFQLSSADVAFSLDVPSGTVIDVSLSFRQPVAAEAVACQNVLVGATTGAIYYRGLDGKALSLTVLPCVGALATI